MQQRTGTAMRYEKGHKDATRRRIVDVAAAHFRRDGVAASGLAGIMSDAGMTNGAFYPHFRSKADLVRETLSEAMAEQSSQIEGWLNTGGLDVAIAAYLSPEHRDEPEVGCASAALLPEIARQPAETRHLYTDRLLTMVRQLSAALPPKTRRREDVAFSIFATAIGALQFARAVDSRELSDRILAAGIAAASALARPASNAPGANR